ncbi:MAG: serine hydrolase [Candidatus Thermoplasmatota archaeon]|nr:serine hydrolase [Candidatus Thermoplasmatota archaeon]
MQRHGHRAKTIALFLIIICIQTSMLSSSLTSSVPIQISTDIKEVVNNREDIAFFDAKMALAMRIAGFPALSTCIIKDDEIIWSKGYGYYDILERKPATIDTIYVLASITKTIVGTAIMQLYDQGFFDLEDDINMYLPFNVRNPHFPDDSITFRMLLSHTSSLNVNTQLEYYWMNFSGDPPFDFFPEPYLREFLLPDGKYYNQSIWSKNFRPGEHAMYANVGFDLLSYLVEILSNESFLIYCDNHIFIPLQMYNTSFNLSILDIQQVAVPYQRFAGRYYQINEMDFLFGEYTPPDNYWRMRFYPAGGLYSTVSDLARFLIMHMNKGVYDGVRILEEETVSLMHTMQEDNNIGYGLAWMHIDLTPSLQVSGHGGDIHGVDTWMLYEPTENIGVIYLANGNPGYSLLPLRGLLPFRWILYTLFTKQADSSRDIQPGLLLTDHSYLLKQQCMVPIDIL